MSVNKNIPWEDSYKIGVSAIDDQHKQLFDLVNRLYALNENENIKEKIRTILYEFREYMLTHFKDEEVYMASIGFPGLTHHKALHEEIVEQLTNIIQTSATLNIIRTKMRVFAKRGLIDHILNEDIKIKDHQKQGFRIDDFEDIPDL